MSDLPWGRRIAHGRLSDRRIIVAVPELGLNFDFQQLSSQIEVL